MNEKAFQAGIGGMSGQDIHWRINHSHISAEMQLYYQEELLKLYAKDSYDRKHTDSGHRDNRIAPK